MKNTTGTKKWAEVDSNNSISTDISKTYKSSDSPRVHHLVHGLGNIENLRKFITELTPEQRAAFTALLGLKDG